MGNRSVNSSASGEAAKPPQTSTAGADKSPRTGDGFGVEGTNKTVAKPKPDNAPPDELGLKRHVEKTPYTRG